MQKLVLAFNMFNFNPPVASIYKAIFLQTIDLKEFSNFAWNILRRPADVQNELKELWRPRRPTLLCRDIWSGEAEIAEKHVIVIHNKRGHKLMHHIDDLDICFGTEAVLGDNMEVAVADEDKVIGGVRVEPAGEVESGFDEEELVVEVPDTEGERGNIERCGRGGRRRTTCRRGCRRSGGGSGGGGEEGRRRGMRRRRGEAEVPMLFAASASASSAFFFELLLHRRWRRRRRDTYF
ncbi:hypothetical protein RIF29_26850 [Crotalaria pallida]|uniref:Uncharacterized protein n=1 Tax=Crotalaria pallida TaxID=3830 RepID=A0AAN9I015_CROPI